ncbi:MAG: DNA polymerase III subunit gamma/tau, partial [Pseudomonadota bacterium]
VSGGGSAGPTARAMLSTASSPALAIAPSPETHPAAIQEVAAAAQPRSRPEAGPRIETFEALVAFVREKRDAKLLFDLERYVRPGPFQHGSFEFTPLPDAPSDIVPRLIHQLQHWTDQRWIVSVADTHTAPTVTEAKQAANDDLRSQALAHPLVQAALEAFPGAELRSVRDLAAMAAAGPVEIGEDEALVDDDFDDDEEEF